MLAQSWFGLIRPIEENSPTLWLILKIIKKIIGTTRDGLFEGFLFVGIGMLFAYGIISISKKKSFICFIISLILLGIEVYVVKALSFARAYDMYIFLVPTTIFGFSYVVQVSLEDRPIYGILRIISSLVFYLHLWIAEIVEKILELISMSLTQSGIIFIMTLLVTILVSVIVVEQAEKPGFKWLKKLWI